VAGLDEDQLRRVVFDDEGVAEGAPDVDCGASGRRETSRGPPGAGGALFAVPTEMVSALSEKATAKDA
jgi:hypothetical protein